MWRTCIDHSSLTSWSFCAGNEEAPKPWAFSLLATPPSDFEHPGAVRTLRDGETQAAEDEKRLQTPEDSSSAGADSWHYRLRDFRLKQQASINFPAYLGVSNNYYNRNWRGLRRLKNVVVVLECKFTIYSKLEVLVVCGPLF